VTTNAVAVPPADSTESADRHAFEAALEATFPASKRPQEGEAVSGIIAGITPDVVLVSIGAKSEALMDLHELDGEKVGDRIDAVVIKAGPDIRLSKKLAGARRFCNALLGESHINPSREEVLLVPGRVSVAEQNQCVRHEE
jgi:hypothetical protein